MIFALDVFSPLLSGNLIEDECDGGLATGGYPSVITLMKADETLFSSLNKSKKVIALWCI